MYVKRFVAAPLYKLYFIITIIIIYFACHTAKKGHQYKTAH